MNLNLSTSPKETSMFLRVTLGILLLAASHYEPTLLSKAIEVATVIVLLLPANKK